MHIPQCLILSPRNQPDIMVKRNVKELVIGTATDSSEIIKNTNVLTDWFCQNNIIIHAYHFDGFCQITLFYIYHLNLNKRGLHLIGFMNTALQIPNCFNYKSSGIIENYYYEIFLNEKLHSQSFLYLKCFFFFLKFWVKKSHSQSCIYISIHLVKFLLFYKLFFNIIVNFK